MATPNKAQDPAAAALSAIEEALNLADFAAPPRDEAPRGDGRPVEFSPDDRISQTSPAPTGKRGDGLPRLPTADDSKLFGPRAERLGDTAAAREAASIPDAAKDVLKADPRYVETPALERQRPAPANDDKESVGAILRTLQAKTSRTPMIIAGVASVLWIVVCSIYLYSDRANLLSETLLQPRTALVLLAMVGPLLFFFMTAALTRRAQEVRLTARSMLQVAVRLAEPEAIATEQMVTLSQAIRREIASMGDGIERALARAGELETLVRSEVSNIERSFGENERRVRSLIDELSSEREAIVGNAEKVRGAIAGVHENLSRDLDGMSERLTSTVAEASDRVNFTIGEKGTRTAARSWRPARSPPPTSPRAATTSPAGCARSPTG